MTGLTVDAQVEVDTFTLQVCLEAAAGEVLAVVGPNGAGKSTLLRAVAGLAPVARGSIRVDDDVLDDTDSGVHVPAEKRSVGLVFQDYRLFPHLSVVDNVAFGLRADGMRRGASRAAVDPLLARLDLSDLARRRPQQLSGGQAQRVALARSLAASPRVLLLDEPLAALDAQTRLEVRGSLRHHLRSYDGVCLLVTHDPLEALVLGDRLVVLEHGRVTQLGTPADVARRPATPYVASLVGLNLYRGRGDGSEIVRLDNGTSIVVAGAAPDGPVLVTFRPAAVAVHLDRPEHGSPRNTWQATVRSIELLTDRVRLGVDGPFPAYADITAAAVAELDLAPGSRVWLAVKSTEVDVYAAPTR